MWRGERGKEKDRLRGYLFPFQWRESLLEVLVSFFALFLVFILNFYITDNPTEGTKGNV